MMNTLGETEGFSGGSVVNNPPSKQGMRVLSLGQEDPLWKEMANRYGILAWKTACTEEPGRLLSMRSQKCQT